MPLPTQGLAPAPGSAPHLSGGPFQLGGRGRALWPDSRGTLNPPPVHRTQGARAPCLPEAKSPGVWGLFGGLEKRKIRVMEKGFFSDTSSVTLKGPQQTTIPISP